ncbi:hypothetical protein BE17_43000 [Sorangium cellulosum]|uniref:Secreted protein n=1 Tax=Sorangium cellulosum TaxID=56 RepID=A0A150RTF4_SORCE|nr:hypothetical protein BE17_43000 [Sorangium cellulosum]
MTGTLPRKKPSRTVMLVIGRASGAYAHPVNTTPALFHSTEPQRTGFSGMTGSGHEVMTRASAAPRQRGWSPSLDPMPVS